MDVDLKDTLDKGKYGFEIESVDSTYVSKNKGTPGLKVTCHVFDGPDQENGTSAIGASKTFIFWLPSAEQSDGGISCAKRVNALIDACGFRDLRLAGQEIPDADFVGKRFVATSTPKSDAEYGDKDELSYIVAYQG